LKADGIRLRMARFLFMVGCILFVALFLTSCGWGTEFKAFQQQVKMGVNPQELQDWAAPMLDGRDATQHELKVEDLPSSVRKIGQSGPEMVFLENDPDSEKSCVVIFWGGGFGHWGLMVGKKSFITSDAKTSAVVRWIDGVYFFHEK
jgi:hypothetical protein